MPYLGKGRTLQIGNEVTHGTIVEATEVIDILSSNIDFKVEKAAREGLTAARGPDGFSVKSYSVGGDFTALARPESVGSILGSVFGTEGTVSVVSTGYHKHPFTASTENTVPSRTLKQIKGTEAKSYSGVKFNSLSIDAKTGEDLKMTIGVKGKLEQDTVLANGLSVPVKAPLAFYGSTVKIDTVTQAMIDTVNFNYDNALDDVYTNALTAEEPVSVGKNITVKIEGYIENSHNTIRDNNYIANQLADIELTWVSPEEVTAGNPYKLVLKMPKTVINEFTSNTEGKGRVRFSLSGTVCDVSGTEMITAEWYDGKATKYLA